jgi:hypothetical protein
MDVVRSAASHYFEIFLKQVFTMGSWFATIINDQLQDNFLSIIAKNRYVFSITSNDVAIVSKSLLCALIFGAEMWYGSILADVFGMCFWALGHFVGPFERFHCVLFFQEGYCLFNSLWSFLGQNGGTAISPSQLFIALVILVNFELLKHIFEHWDQTFGVFTHHVCKFKDFCVNRVKSW